MKRVVFAVIAACLLAGCTFNTVTGQVLGDIMAGTTNDNQATAPFGTEKCARDGSLTAEACWQLHTGVLGWATHAGTAWTPTDVNHQDPTTDPNLLTVCGAPGSQTELNLYPDHVVVNDGTCVNKDASAWTGPTNGQIAHYLIYGCVNIQGGTGTVVDTYLIDPDPNYKCSHGDAGGAVLDSGATLGNGLYGIYKYVTVDMTGSTGGNEEGIGNDQFECWNCNVFGGAHPFFLGGDNVSDSHIKITDSMSPRAMGRDWPDSNPADCIHMGNVFAWSTGYVDFEHDWLSLDDGTSSDPTFHTQCSSGAILNHAGITHLTVNRSYLSGGSNYNYATTCVGATYQTFTNDIMGPATYGLPSGVEHSSPTEGDVWSGNTLPDGTPLASPGC